MRQDIKDLRTLQIACVLLLRYTENLNLRQVVSDYYHIIATDTTNGLRFGVYVTNSNYSRNDAYAEYVNKLKTINLDDENNRIPIIIIAVNEKSESATFGFQLGWRWGKARIYTKTSMRRLCPKNISIMMDTIKSMDETIRLLSENGMKVIKKIYVEKQTGTLVHHAEIVYLRDFTDHYKMHQKEVVDEREKFERLLNGTPQNEYPEDLLDKIIFDAISREYPSARKNSSLMLFSTELRDLQLYSGFNKVVSYINVEPDISRIPQELLPLLNGLESISFPQELFINPPTDVSIFENVVFRLTYPFKGWLEIYNEIKLKLTTKHSPTEFFVN